LYIASKLGVVSLTRTAALEYARHGIRVNAANPGLIDTQIARDVVNRDEQAYGELAKNVPIGRAGRPKKLRLSSCGCRDCRSTRRPRRC
jgi:NAD(P)-dependent dehydrogenase (short-subunit alcohol dehydrogenase family)